MKALAPSPLYAGTDRPQAPLVVMLSAAHPPEDVRVVGKEGAALAAAGWRVWHLCPQPVSSPPAAGVPARSRGVILAPYRRRPGWLGRLLGIPALARRARACDAAVLHASEPDSWLAALIAARGRDTRVVLDVHEHYPSRLDHHLPRALRPVLAPPARAAIRLACRAMAARADAVVVAKDGLDGDFRAAPRLLAVRNYAEPLPLTPRRHAPGPLVLAHLGSLTRSRGSEEMLQALALGPSQARLRLIGRFADGSEADFLTLTRLLLLEDRVERLGWMPQPAALEALARADIGLVLFQPGVENHRLALPHKLFDCMLAGLPVIAPDFATEVAAVVRDSDCGLLVDTACPRAIAAAMERLRDPALRARMGAAGRAAALGRYGWAAEAERLTGLYGRLAPLPGRG